jgi:hypothetical protein
VIPQADRANAPMAGRRTVLAPLAPEHLPHLWNLEMRSHVTTIRYYTERIQAVSGFQGVVVSGRVGRLGPV